MIRKLGTAAATVALSITMVLGLGGVAEAKAPVVSGHTTCGLTSTATLNPPLVLSIPNKPNGQPGKDKPSKINVTGTVSGCTTAQQTGDVVSSGTIVAKGKTTSHLCTNLGSGNPIPLKGKITWNDNVKTKFAGNIGTAVVNDNGVIVPADSNAVVSHPNGHIQFPITGSSSGKGFLGNSMTARYITTETISQFAVACANNNEGSFHSTASGDDNHRSIVSF